MDKEKVRTVARGATRGAAQIAGVIGVGTVMTKAFKMLALSGSGRYETIALRVGYYMISAAVTSLAINAVVNEVEPIVDLVVDLTIRD